MRYGRMVRNGIEYGRMVRNGTTYGNWSGFDESLQAVLDYAASQGYAIPSQPHLVALDELLKGEKNDSGTWGLSDLKYIFANDGDNNFRTLNYINPTTYKATLFGGITRTDYGFEGNAIDGYITTGFTLSGGVNYKLNDAHICAVVYKAFVTANRDHMSGVTGNVTYNNWRNNNNMFQRINTNATLPVNMDYSGSGMKVIRRNASTHLSGISGTTVIGDIAADSAALTGAQQLFRRNTQDYSDMGFSMFTMGSFMGNDQYLSLRTLVNNYLTSIGLEARA